MNKPRLTATEKTLLQAGFRQIYTPAEAEPLPPATPSRLATFQPGQRITPRQVCTRRHPPPRPQAMPEATLIRELRTRRIGRPSTYAETVTTLLARRYAIRVAGGKLQSTQRGREVCAFLLKTFPKLCAYEFTARMEAALDTLAHGQTTYEATVRAFWKHLPQPPPSPKKEQK